MINKLLDKAGYDGCKHIIVSATISSVLSLALPTLYVTLIVTIIGVTKELYDKLSGRGTAEWKDILCNAIGLLIGI